MAGLGGAEPGQGQGIQGGLGRGRELAEALRHVAVHVQECVRESTDPGLPPDAAYHLGVQRDPLPPGHERHRFQETLDLAELQVRELHRTLALRGRRALAGEKAGPVGRAEDRVQWSGVQAV